MSPKPFFLPRPVNADAVTPSEAIYGTLEVQILNYQGDRPIIIVVLYVVLSNSDCLY